MERSAKHIAERVEKAATNLGTDSTELRVAKTVAILQVLEDFPVTRENIAALLHPAVDVASQTAVDAAVKRPIEEVTVPLSEIDGQIRFISEAVLFPTLICKIPAVFSHAVSPRTGAPRCCNPNSPNGFRATHRLFHRLFHARMQPPA